jgi:hypothetical protein
MATTILGGFVFEIGFKLGLAQKLRTSNHLYREVWQSEFEDLVHTILLNKDKLGKIGEILEKELESVINPQAFGLKEKPLIEILKEKGINVGEREKILLGLLETGVYEGWLFGQDLLREVNPTRIFKRGEKGGGIFPRKLTIFAEDTSEAGIYTNADLILKTERFNPSVKKKVRELHIYDLKLYGGLRHIRYMLLPFTRSSEERYVPPLRYGYQLAIAIGNTDLRNFAEALLEVGNKIASEVLETDPELKALMQVCSYLFDYLSKNSEEQIDKVHFGIITPTADGLVFSFDKQDLDFPYYSNSFKRLYKLILFF